MVSFFFEKNFVKNVSALYLWHLSDGCQVLAFGWIRFKIRLKITQNIKQHSIWKLFTRSKPKKENSVRIVKALLKKPMIRQQALVLARM